jgi:hypothetical protein
MRKRRGDYSGKRVLILAGEFAGQEGICLGPSAEQDKWAVSPDNNNEILSLSFESEFGLLFGTSADGAVN